MNTIDISVVVTTYRRPQMVKDLILSYQWQSYTNSELVIVDDCVEDTDTATMVAQFIERDSRIRFIKNTENLGYSRNFLKSLEQARGKYIITLGDDDIFIHRDALKRYVEIFELHPKVGFIYSNILQFNQHYEMDFVYRHFGMDRLFKTPAESLRGIWLKSCYIPGIGLRNNISYADIYPKEDWLFPQVEMIGKVLGTSQAYGIADFLIGGRAHDDQLGFEAVKGKRIKKNERHASLELLDIFGRLMTYFKERGIVVESDDSFVKQFFVDSHASILPTEKIHTGNGHLLRVFWEAVGRNKSILLDVRYMFYMTLSLLLPGSVLLVLKSRYKKYLVEKKWKRERTSFQEALRDMSVLPRSQ